MSPHRELSILTAALFVLLSSTTVDAANITVTTTADTILPDGQTSLREAFIQANTNLGDDTIILQNGALYLLDFCASGTLQHTEAAPLTIDGNGATLQNNCLDLGMIEATNGDASLAIDNIEMIGFTSTVSLDGAAISVVAGDTVITNTNIHGFEANSGNVINAGDGTAGASGASLTVDNTQIWDNTGNGIRITLGGVSITDAMIYDNSLSGVALTDGSPLVVTNSEVRDNGRAGIRTTGQGSTSAIINDSMVTDNGDTGLICLGCETVTITDSMISGNGAAPIGLLGGGVRISYDQDDPLDAPVTTITNSHIDNNTATGSGGGISIVVLESTEPTAPPAQLTIQDSTINSNVTEDPPTTTHGGGIYVETGGLTLINSHVDGNRAGPVGGSTQSSGGGIYVEELGVVTGATNVTFTSSTVDNNQSNRWGGGMFRRQAGQLNTHDTSVSGNLSDVSGGGFFLVGAEVSLVETVVADNNAPAGGGIQYVRFFDIITGSLTLTRSTVSGNSATGATGGGINVGDDGFETPILIENSTISGNSATTSGGGISMLFGGALTLNHASLANNSAPSGANLSHDISGVLGSLSVTASFFAWPNGGQNCDLGGGAPSSGGFSFADDASCALGPSDLVAMVDPELGPLTDNGGPTQTHLPSMTSPVAGLVPVISCTLAVDQRNIARPQGSVCEAGAVEIEEMGAAPLMGTPGDDVLIGTPGNDLILGLGGNDLLIGLGGDDTIESGPGQDLVFGGSGDDIIEGGPGRDFLIGGPGDDLLLGGPGRDILFGGPGDDTLEGGRGKDRCFPTGYATGDC